APLCFEVGGRAGLVWLWLEDVADQVGPCWPVARFALAARHLGRLNGTYLAARPLPDYTWLQRTLLRWRVERNIAFWAAFDAARDAPWLRRCWPGTWVFAGGAYGSGGRPSWTCSTVYRSSWCTAMPTAATSSRGLG